METIKQKDVFIDKPILIGQKFIPIGKRKDVYTVIDIYRTYNNKRELIDTQFVCEHTFMGQSIKSQHCRTTIMRSEWVN